MDDEPKLKDVIPKLVEFTTALAITIATVDRLATQGAPQVTTPPVQPSSSWSSAGEKPPATPLISHLYWTPLTRIGIGRRRRTSLSPGGRQSFMAGARAPQNMGQVRSKSSDPPHITLPSHPGYQPSIRIQM